MIKFYADAGFELDLTDTSITLIEENDLFFDFFIRDYSLPSTSNIEKFTNESLRFLNLENILIPDTTFKGQLFIDTVYKQASLTIIAVEGEEIKHIIYYGSTTIELLETPLQELPFPIINISSLVSYAKTIIGKSYPEVGFNFPMVIDEKFKEKTNYEKFEGIINNYENGNFKTNFIDSSSGQSIVNNINVVTPFPYLMEILKVGFNASNLLMNGDFVNDPANNNLILVTSKFIEKFSTLTELIQSFSTSISEYIENGSVVSEFKLLLNITATGSYKLKILLNLPVNISVQSLVVTLNSTVIYESNLNNINEISDINISDISMFGVVNVVLKTSQTSLNLQNYNSFELTSSETKMNIFPTTFSIKEVLPDMNFGALLKKVKNIFNLKITVDANIVRMDYIDRVLNETQYENKDNFKTIDPPKTFSKVKLFELKYNDNEFVYVNAFGQTFNAAAYSDSEKKPIDLNVKVLPIELFNNIFTAKISEEDPDFKLLLYNGLQTASNLPLAVETVLGKTFKLDDIFNLRYKKWLLFLLNATTYNESFDCNIFENFDINTGQLKYNQKHIYKSIKRKRINEDTWTYTIESLTLN